MEDRVLLSTLTVTNDNDSGSGSLRAELGAAVAGDTIRFAPSAYGTITLTSGELNVATSVDIEGPSAAQLIVSAGGKSRVFYVPPTIAATISGLTITDGSAGSALHGGGLYNQGTTTITDCTISGNSAGAGGGVASRTNSGTDQALTLTDCTISGNSASEGGGVYNYGLATLNHCTISGNSAGRGAGVMNSHTDVYPVATLTLNSCTISGNSGGNNGVGGGLYNANGVTLNGCTISGNSAGKGGGLYNFGSYDGTATLHGCTISGNSASKGGGLYNRGVAAVNACTISGNSAVNGGGLYNGQPAAGYALSLTLTNCTVTGNTSNHDGGGLNNRGTATLTNCTVAGNTAENGGGLFISSKAVLKNTIVAGNTSSGGSANDIRGTVDVASSSSYNLIGTGGSGGLTDSKGNHVGVANPGLGSLVNNGGPTQTIALLPGSPAINAGSNALIPAGVTTDQRGTGFPRIVGGTVDIGAFESSNETVVTSLASSANPSTYGQSVTFTATVTVGGGGVPQGTVEFFNGSTDLGAGSALVGSGSDSATSTFSIATLGAKLHTIQAVYTPSSVFQESIGTLNQTVNQATPTINWANPAAINYGMPLSATQLDATASWTVDGKTVNVLGTFTYSPPAGTVLNTGSNQTLSVSFKPINTADYTSATAQATINVRRATPHFSGLTPSQAIVSGTASIILAGTITSNTSAIPPGYVSITIDGENQTAAIEANGSFSLTFDTQAIPASNTPYTITYTYAGGPNFRATSNTLTDLRVHRG